MDRVTLSFIRTVAGSTRWAKSLQPLLSSTTTPFKGRWLCNRPFPAWRQDLLAPTSPRKWSSRRTAGLSTRQSSAPHHCHLLNRQQRGTQTARRSLDHGGLSAALHIRSKRRFLLCVQSAQRQHHLLQGPSRDRTAFVYWAICAGWNAVDRDLPFLRKDGAWYLLPRYPQN